MKTVEPATRKARVKVTSVDETRRQAEERRGSALTLAVFVRQARQCRAQRVADGRHGAQYAHRLAEPLAALVEVMAGPYENIVFPATTTGRNVAPRVAARLDVMVISDVVAIEGPDTFVRPIYAGNRDADHAVGPRDEGTHPCAARRSRLPWRAGGGPDRASEAAADPGLYSWVEDEIAASDRPELAPTKTTVSGGRGVRSEENFRIVEVLADKLGTAVGASRAAGRIRLGFERLAGWTYRHGGGPLALHRRPHLRRDPAPSQHEGL